MSVKHNYLETIGYKPQVSEISVAELVINLSDGTLWSKNGANAVIKVGGGGAVGGGVDAVFYENDQVVNNDYTITAGKNAMSAGDITISDGVTVTIPTGSRWVIN